MAGQSGSHHSSFHGQSASAEAQSNGGLEFTTNLDDRTTPADASLTIFDRGRSHQ